jgi:hypothetical protein
MDNDILYRSGVQNGWTDMAKRVPIIDTGIVDPTTASKTDENCASGRAV